MKKNTKKKKKTKKAKTDVNELLKNVSIPKGLELESIDLEKANFYVHCQNHLGLTLITKKKLH